MTTSAWIGLAGLVAFVAAVVRVVRSERRGASHADDGTMPLFVPGNGGSDHG